MKKKDIELVQFIELRYADPICSMDLTDSHLLYGTMLGAIKIFIINEKKLICCSDTQDEYISGVKIDEKENKLYICIGDVKICQYYIGNKEALTSIDNYENEEAHEKKCDNCLTMFSNNYLIRNFIEYTSSKKKEENKEEEKKSENSEYTLVSIKSIIENDGSNEIVCKLKMSEYSVPFDFDGTNFIFIEFVEQNNRTFNVYDVNSKEMKTTIKIEEAFQDEHIGHISHLKIINDDLLFIVRDYNICEIRNFKLELNQKLTIKTSEILAFDILFNENKEEDKSDINTDINNNTKEILYIVLLDIDTNVFLYDYKEDKNILLINLDNDDIGIDKDIKGQGFFLLNYPYYIKISKKYIAISSDYGCILIEYNNKFKTI